MEDQITVLIVDDERAGREALEGVLFSQGYKLVFAESGQDAYEKALEFTPDVVLLDVMMPNMDGFEVCRLMRSNPLLAEIPILFVTALDDRSSRIKGIEVGADDFITKPFDRIELRTRVRTITRLNRYRRLLVEKVRFAWVMEQAKECYIILNQAGNILYANSSALDLLSLPSDEDALSAVNFSEWVQRQYQCEPEEVWAEWKEQALTDRPMYLIRAETELCRPVWLQVETLNLPSGSQSSNLIRISEISDQVSSYQEMWNFHSVMIHKLRTPLANIVLGADMLARNTGRFSSEDIQEIARAIFMGTKRIENEIEEVLRFISLPSISVTDHYVHLEQLESLASGVSEEIGITSLTFKADPAVQPHTLVKLSNQGMSIILAEIFENAKKFHPQLNPQIEITLSIMEPNQITIRIRDNGVYLSPTQLSKVWIPYFQSEKYFTGEVSGMGLGLPTVASIVWSAGGKCRLYNREDIPGIVAELRLPAVESLPS